MKIVLPLAFTLAQLFAVNTFAQPAAPAEAVPPGTKLPAAQPKASPEEKLQAKAARKQEGVAAVKQQVSGEGTPIPEKKAKVAKTDRQEARASRKAESARANKAGEITSKGETGLAK